MDTLDSRWLDDERNRITTWAHTQCDERFPARYRPAEITNPEVRAWVEAFWRHETDTPGLLLIGPVGSGKTWHAYAALRAAVTHPFLSRAGHPYASAWNALTFNDYVAGMRPRDRHDSEGGYRRLASTPVLLVDDLGAAKHTDFVEEITFRLINDRYNNQLPTIFTTNLNPDELTRYIGDRVASRLKQTCRPVQLTGTDRRENHPETALERSYTPVHPETVTAPWGNAADDASRRHRRIMMETMARMIQEKGLHARD